MDEDGLLNLEETAAKRVMGIRGRKEESQAVSRQNGQWYGGLVDQQSNTRGWSATLKGSEVKKGDQNRWEGRN